MADAATFPWLQVATILAGNGIITYLVTWVREAKREQETRMRDGRYTALRIAAVLERFAHECAEMISHNKDADPHFEPAPAPRFKLPELGAYPTDADWKALEPALASRAVALPLEVEVSQGHIDFWWRVDGDAYYMMGEADNQAGKCGYRAWTLATDLRRHYELPDAHLLEVSWAWVDELKEHHRQAMERLAARKAEEAEASKLEEAL
jgi:hypothetical protein